MKNSETTTLPIDDPVMDTSVSDAKWLLGSVAAIGLFVVSMGMFASVVSA